MRSINEYRFYELGTVLLPLREVSKDKKVGEVVIDLYSAQFLLEPFLNDQVVPLKVSKNSGQQLLSYIKEITSLLEANNAAELEKPLNVLRAYRISNAVKRFETVFAAELQVLDTYFVSQTGIYSTPDLIEHAENVFPEAIRRTIPEQAVKDIRQAGRCLAFDLPTAASFHVLRAAEALIRAYYAAVVGSPPKMKSRNWGRYIDHLKKNGANSKILAAIDQIREIHRNPIMHPEDFLTQEDADALFGMVQGLIVSIAADIEKWKCQRADMQAVASASASAAKDNA